jgi:hypothetical protein
MRILYIGQLAAFGSCLASAQGTFQNLDFDATLIPEDQSPGRVNVTDALPGWTVYIGTNAQTQMGFNFASFGGTSISLQGTNTTAFPGINCNVPGFYCGYSALLQGGLAGGDLVPIDASIAQTGLIPADSKSIRFETLGGSFPLVVSVGGHALPLAVISLTGNVFVLGADISAYAGQTAELKFDALAPPIGTFPSPSNWEIDSIQFSTSTIPEPGALALVGLGCLVSAWRWFGRKQ